ncbi:MAG: pyridoxamine 5'-phosphate oxidase family protein [Pseudomonadales bacterium]
MNTIHVAQQQSVIDIDSSSSTSPFHRGEQAIQTQLGVRENMERFGSRVIRDHLPEQHQQFYQQLPYLFLGHVDQHGWPWASMVTGQAGFISSPDSTHLNIAAAPIAGDPLFANLRNGAPVGVVGVELHTRRRNRLSAEVDAISAGSFSLKVRQSFGNCPQYIQARKMLTRSVSEFKVVEMSSNTRLSTEMKTLIQGSDTFFVSSYLADESGHASEGVDVSHRGGQAGFVRVDDDHLLTIPDYAGNFHFNTLGNFIENPKAGLLFIDWTQGHLLMLTGHAEVLWDDEQLPFFEGAERLWQFRMVKGVYLKNAIEAKWSFDSWSPNTLLTGSWDAVSERQQAHEQRTAWRSYTVEQIVDESASIRSFYFVPEHGSNVDFSPGQFLTVRASVNGRSLIRTYTVSSAPADPHYRISVKRDGEFSNYLHDELGVGDKIELRAPSGDFVFDASEPSPAVLIAAGVGITPMISMLRHALVESVRVRTMRPIHLLLLARNNAERAFNNEINALSQKFPGQFKVTWCLSKPEDSLQPELDYQHRGRLTHGILEEVIDNPEANVYLCGPPEFMQSTYNLLSDLTITDERIFSEAFGPAAIKRNQVEVAPVNSAEEALVTVLDASGQQLMEQRWQPSDGNLLDFAENHGLSLPFSCRSGRCGACSTTLLAGELVYDRSVSAPSDDTTALLCCALPAAASGFVDGLQNLTLKLIE